MFGFRLPGTRVVAIATGALGLAFVGSLPAGAATNGHATTLKQWSNTHGGRLTAIVNDVEELIRPNAASSKSVCNDLARAVDAAKRAPAPPTVKSEWNTMLADLGKVASRCGGGGSSAKNAGNALGKILGTMIKDKVPLGNRLLTRLQHAGSFSANTTTTTTTKPTTNLAVGQSQELTKAGKPYVTVEVAQFVDPATASNTFEAPGTGYELVAVKWILSNPSSAPFTTDINGDVKIYDATGQGFTTTFATTTAGPNFPSGEVSLAPGGTASGWTAFKVPTSPPVTEVEFTPEAGFATNATTYWNLGG